MSEVLENFLPSHLPISGLAAYGIYVRNGIMAAECLSKSLYPISTEQMLTRMVQGGQALLPCGESSAQYCWTYEAHRVYVAARADGAALALLVENNPNAQIARIKETLQDFLDLTGL